MADFVSSLPFLTETRYTCPVNTRDRAGKGGGGGMAGALASGGEEGGIGKEGGTGRKWEE